MDPLTIASLGATVFGALSGNSAAKKTQKLAEQQAAQQNAIAQQQQQLAEEMARRGIATQIDANGNVTAYDQATNTWKSVLAPTQQKIQNLSDAEQINQLQTDAPVNRIQSLADAIRRQKESGTANTLLGQYDAQLSHPQYNGQSLANSLSLSRQKAVSQGFDETSNALATQALRSGAGGMGVLGGALAKQKAQAIAQTMGTPDIEGAQLADSMNSARTGDLLSQYNTMAGRAAATPQVSFNPSGVGAALTAALAGSKNTGVNALSGQSSLLNSAASNLKLPPTDTTGSSLATSIQDILGALGGLGVGGGGTKKPASSSTGFQWDTSMGA